MPFNIPPEWLIGPASGLVISLVFASLFWKFANKMLDKFEKNNERLITAFEGEVKACEERYRQVLDEVFRLKEQT